MIAYASRTGTKKTLVALRKAGWRLLVTAGAVIRNEGFPYALDNGAYSLWSRGLSFDSRSFRQAMSKLAKNADFVVVPDIVAGGLQSLHFSLSWLDEVLSQTNIALIAVQDGMMPADISGLLGARVGIFVGGTTKWKLETMNDWGKLASRSGCWLHVGRVNTARRIRLCHFAGANSFDGSSVSRFPSTLNLLDSARAQRTLFSVSQCR